MSDVIDTRFSNNDLIPLFIDKRPIVFLISDIPNIFRLDLSAPVDKPLSYALTMIETFIFEKFFTARTKDELPLPPEKIATCISFVPQLKEYQDKARGPTQNLYLLLYENL